MKYSIEKAIAAGIEPVVDEIIALEKTVAQLQTALDALTKCVQQMQQARDAETASQPKGAARTRAPRVTSETAPH